MKRVKFIYNPSAGETQLAARLDEIITLYQRRGFSVVPYRLDFRSDTEMITADLDSGYDHLVVAGGDGSVNFVVNRLKSAGYDIPLGIIPAGTANDFASTIGMDETDVVKACRSIIDGTVRSVDLGRANASYFVNVFSCGLFTDISQKTPTILKNTFGKLAYYVGGLGELSRFRKMNITIESDGGSFDGSSIIFFVFNGQTAGKLKIAYLSEIDDGMLDVLILKGDNTFKSLQTVFQYLSKLGGIGGMKDYPQGVEHIRCSRLHATCTTDEHTDIDGQTGPDFPLDITCLKGALKVITPAKG